MKQSIFKNTIYKIILNLCNLVIPLFVGPHIAKTIQPELYGIYNRVYAEFGVFLTLASFGIYNYGVREISKIRNDKKKLSQVFTSLFIIGIVANLIVGCIYVIYFLNRSINDVDIIIYSVMLTQIIGNIFYIEFVNEALENFGFIAKKTIAIRLLYFGAIFLFVKKANDVIIYAAIVSLTVLLNNLASYFYIHKKIKFDFHNLQITSHLIPLIVTLIYSNSEMLYTQLDKVMLGPYVSDIAVTEYTLATTIVGMLGVIPLSLIAVTIPRLSHYLASGEHENYERTLKNVAATYMSVAIPMSLGVVVLAEEIMQIYTFNVYTYAFPVLIIASLTRIIYGYFTISSNLVMYISSMERQLMVMSIGGGLLNLALNFILVFNRGFSPVTAALTTMIADLIETIIAIYYTKRKINITYGFFSKRICGYYVISFMFIPIAYIMKKIFSNMIIHTSLTVFLCILVYGLYMFFTRDPIIQTIAEKFHLKFLLRR